MGPRCAPAACLIVLVLMPAIAAKAAVYQNEPADDTYLEPSAPDETRGDWDTMWVFGYIGPGSHPLLKFDLAAIPDSAVISSATLYLYNYQSASDRHTLVSRAANDAWEEETVTLNSYAPGTLTILGNTVPAGGCYNVWTLSGWDYPVDLADNALTLMLQFENEGDGFYKYNKYYSKEAAGLHPYLEIEYVPEPASVSLVALGGAALLLRLRRRGR